MTNLKTYWLLLTMAFAAWRLYKWQRLRQKMRNRLLYWFLPGIWNICWNHYDKYDQDDGIRVQESKPRWIRWYTEIQIIREYRYCRIAFGETRIAIILQGSYVKLMIWRPGRVFYDGHWR